jgi:hypothetical protein
MSSKFATLERYGVICLGICFLSILFCLPDVMAGNGCKWKDAGWFLECRSGSWGLGTGCIGLRNVSGKEVRVLVNDSDRTNGHEKFSEGKYQKADYKGSLTVHTCKTKQNGQWKKIKCYDVFDRGKNEPSEGGCGCKGFNCLPGW